MDGRADVARVDRGDRDLVAVLEPQRVAVGGQAALAHAVGGAPRQREVGQTGGDVDHPTARFAQRGQRRRRHPPRADQVDVDHRERVVVGRGAGRLRQPEAGVVDQHVEPAELADRLGDGLVDRLLLAHVAGEDVGTGQQVQPEHAGAALAQHRRGRRADAAGRAGEQHPHAGTGSRTGESMTYSDGSSVATRRRNFHVQSGHAVELRPVWSRYQLAQPVFHTVPSSLRSSSAL